MTTEQTGRRPRPNPVSSWSWGLFADWCASMDVQPIPATADVLTSFLDAFPAARSTQVKRLATILAVHQTAGQSIEIPRLTRPVDSLWAPRPGLLDPPGALAQLRRYRFPTGLTGRRDGFLIALTGVLGLTREQARNKTPEDIDIAPGTTTILGQDVPEAEVPGECPRCAVAGWLCVIAPHYERLRGSYLPLLDPTTANPHVHVCERSTGDLWQRGVALLPSIDRTGAVGTGGFLSTRAITSIIAARRIPTGRMEKTGPVLTGHGRYQAATSGELAAAQDDVLDQVNEVNRHLEKLLAEATALNRILHGDVGGHRS